MRRRLGQSLRLGVGAGAVALVQARRWGGAPLALLAEHPYEGSAGLAQALDAVLEPAYAGWPLTIVLADDLVRLWQVTPPPQASRLADLEAAAALRFQLLYGEPAAGWTLRAGWDLDRPFLAAALPRALQASIEQGARRHRLVETVPQFVVNFNRWCGALKPGAWYGQLHDRVLTLGAIDAGALVAVRAQALPDGADAAWLAQHLAREALRLNLAVPERLQLCGSVPPGWLGAACARLGAAAPAGWSAAALLAASGSAA
ncbi:MAG: hypothetical protein QFF03_12505 [Pseudomonadota bacterium]|nr:hypothetical protein [Pseudomonadota bacterium]